VKAIEATVTVTTDGKITIQLPPDIPPGEHHKSPALKWRKEV